MRSPRHSHSAPSSTAAVASKALFARAPIGFYLMLAWMLTAFLALAVVLGVSKMRASDAAHHRQIVSARADQRLVENRDAFTLLSLEEPTASAGATTAVTVKTTSLEPDFYDEADAASVGRSDPFSPLVSPPGAEAVESGDVVRDPYQDVSFTGVVRNKTDAVAILKIRSASGAGSTLIRRPGAAFDLNGTRVVVKRIESGRVWLQGPDGLRALNLEMFVDRINTATQEDNVSKDAFDKLAEPDDKAVPGGDATGGKKKQPAASEDS
ncbi:MAG: hypothetical protein IPK79_02440 [Vampirovibrionales bacterium]|nr:hypothetical protein [Vampirovibrionales bacterium]